MKFREFFFNKLFSLRNLFFIGNFLLLFLFLMVLAQDYMREWKPFQKEYKRLEKERINRMIRDSGDPSVKTALKDELSKVSSLRPEIKQMMVTNLNRIDRCVSCHLGYDGLVNPALFNEFENHPYATPKNEIHQKHAFEKFGCTTCHEGQGLATTFVGAGHMPQNETQKSRWKDDHDWKVVEYWEHPMKAGPLVYASCTKCHQAHPDVPGMKIVREGERLSFEYGCIGCHQINGKGGTIAPDLADETSVKPTTRIDFGQAVHAGLITKNERTLENWIRLHFTTAPAFLTPGDPLGLMSPDPKNPQPVAPSAMPYFGFSKEESEALVAYVLSLKREEIPYSYTIFSPKKPEPKFASAVRQGRYVYQKYGCAGCHGKNADQGILVYNKQGGRVPDLVKTVGTFTREELVKKIQDGVNPEEKEDELGPTPPLYMPSFKDRIQGRELDDLVTYLLSIAVQYDDW